MPHGPRRSVGRPAGVDGDPVDCTRCGRRFADERLLALHRGIEHAAVLDAGERAAYEAAYAAETEVLREYRLKALAVLVLLYFGLLFAYAAAT